MPGVTDIVNVALRKIGAKAITSLGDGSDNANIADDLYTEVRDDLLASNPWNFATKRVKLAQVATTPISEFDYAYALPSDWIRTVSVHDNDAGHGTVLYRSEFLDSQRVLVASSNQLYLRYIYRVTDPNLMSSNFRKAFEAELAKELCIPITESNTLFEQLDKGAKRALNKARSTDAMGSFPELRPRGSWASARGGRNRNDFLSD